MLSSFISCLGQAIAMPHLGSMVFAGVSAAIFAVSLVFLVSWLFFWSVLSTLYCQTQGIIRSAGAWHITSVAFLVSWGCQS
jgi:hypothetical protein